LYGTPGKQQSRKKDIRDWQGNTAEDAESRLQKAMTSWTTEELRAVSRLCGLTPSKNKSEFEKALVVFLRKPYCVSPGKEPAKPQTKKKGTKRSVEEPSSKRAKQKQEAQDCVESTRCDLEASIDDVDEQFRQYEEVRRPTLVGMYPDLDTSDVTVLVTREWEEILNGAAPEDAFKTARASLPSLMAKRAEAATAAVH
jgi:hypothetical protein